jgi:GNAT superfamily N-acetyltransferase
VKSSEKSVTTYYLEMQSSSWLKEKCESKGLVVSECEVAQFQVNRFLYQLIGEDWEWKSKLSWADGQWRSLVESENHRTWMAYLNGSVAGYYELSKTESDVEILAFGLAPPFIGKGFGGYFLSYAVKSAWSWVGAERVWLHTDSLDHPRALQNYCARGFKIFREEPANR